MLMANSTNEQRLASPPFFPHQFNPTQRRTAARHGVDGFCSSCFFLSFVQPPGYKREKKRKKKMKTISGLASR